jgi:hypothetical protein
LTSTCFCLGAKLFWLNFTTMSVGL